MSESLKACQVSEEYAVDIPNEFADLVVERYRGYIAGGDVRELVKWLFDNGWMDESTARKALIKDNYFKLIKNGDTAHEAKLTVAVNYECSYNHVRRVIYETVEIQ